MFYKFYSLSKSYDTSQLTLERAKTARLAVQIVGELVEQYGQ
ncbi:unnamed protein product, partial [Rotaria magnacalcarata]